MPISVLALVIIPVGSINYKSPLTKPKPLNVRGYRSLQQQELVNPPLECCEMVIWWKAFISEGVPKSCCASKKAWLIKLSPAHRRINCMTMQLLRKASASNSDDFGRYEIRKLRGTFRIVIRVEQAHDSNIPPVWQGLQIRRRSGAY